ncbi:MAG: ATP-binding protein [Clostridium sp.]|nr:ATP-binding protein [Clostridium sp.]
MAGFTIDLVGRVKNFDLPKTQPLIPLYEAVVNSIYAIEERQSKETFEGRIDIQIVRESQQVASIDGIDSSINEIIGFTIIDNGIGLDENNMRSFLQSDSAYRADKGGKGVGRFSWLKAFQKTEVESIFKDDGVWVKRSFDFSLDNLDIDDGLEKVGDVSDNMTRISLVNYLPVYRKHVKNKKAETIAMKLMQHCMMYLMSPKCPQINVLDEERFCLNLMLKEKTKREEKEIDIFVKDQTFKLLNIKIEDASIDGNKLFLYANDRMVKPINLDKEIVDLDKAIYANRGYFYVGIISGTYLDDNVDTSRTSFDISEDNEDTDISMKDIIECAKEQIENYLSEYLNEVRKNKEERIKKYISDQAPQFGHLLRYMPEEIKKIKPTITDSGLDEELYKIKRKFDVELKKSSKEIMDKMDVGAENYEEYSGKLEEQFEKISDANKSALADYVAHRKIILELLKKGIKKNNDDKFNKESYLHNLIYPMRRTSGEIEYQAHNLWLIDERLAYSEYISSDIPFNNNPKEERTDILFLNNPVAVSDEENIGREYGTIVIFELKRPMRDDYSRAENPIVQLVDYVNKLSTNKVADKYGRIIKVGDNTQFYLYAICDLTPNLVKVAEDEDFKETPDKRGYYKYHDKKHAYIEILSYDKIIEDSEKRNRILFDKLGI